MNITPIQRIALTATLVVGAAQGAHATIVYDNLNASLFSSDNIAQFGPLADSFSVGNVVAALTDVKIRLKGDPAASGGDITVSLLADNNTAPGAPIAVLGSVAANTLGANVVYDFAPNAAIPLPGNARYWVEVTTANTSAAWIWSQDVSGTGVAAEFYFGNNAVANNPPGPYLMQVDVKQSPVPLPASIWSIGAALGVLTARRRRHGR